MAHSAPGGRNRLSVLDYSPSRASSAREEHAHSEMDLERVGVYSLLVNLGLSVAKLALGAVSGSLALTADGIHSLVDVIASLAVLAGLRLSTRRTHTFPYGLYKVENLVEVVVALLIFVAGYEIIRQAFGGQVTLMPPPYYVVAGVVAAIVGPLLFSRYELEIGRATGSPSLLADSRHFQIDVLASSIVLVAIVGSYFGLTLDRYAALAVVGFIVWSGWELLRDGMRVLLDASIEPETIERAERILAQAPAVSTVHWVTGRNSGRYRFLEAEVTLRTRDLEMAHRASEEMEAELRREIPNLDRVIIHYEPEERPIRRLAVPLADMAGSLAPKFGEAPYFALVDLQTAEHRVLREEIASNPFATLERGRGLRVAEWLVAQKVDWLLSREEVAGKAPGYVLANGGVIMRRTDARHLQDVLAQEMGGAGG